MHAVALLAKFFGLGFSALLPVVNPIGSALVFFGLVGNASQKVFRDLARKIAIRMTVFMATVELIGAALLTFFGISLPVVQVAGGLVLASMGWGLLNQQAPSNRGEQEAEEADTGSLQNEVFYPLTFPVTVGPACVVVMLTLSAHAAVRGTVDNAMAHVGIFLSVVALSVIVFFCYASAPRLTAKISPQTAHGVLRIIAFVLLCIGVQITWNGVESLIKIVMKSA
jgi:multiple antibiotic resistance protein